MRSEGGPEGIATSVGAGPTPVPSPPQGRVGLGGDKVKHGAGGKEMHSQTDGAEGEARGGILE